MINRTEKSLRNISYNLINVVLNVILLFFVRTVFINVLDDRFLGLNGIFLNIFSFLSLAELGIGTAIVYKLYEPLAIKDEERINALMRFYKKAYRIISLVIIILAISLIPFLDIIIKDDTSFTNIYIIFAIYLMQTVSSYLFFAYKSSLLKADQNEYLISKIGLTFNVISALMQVLAIVLYESYIIYLLVLVTINIAKNIIIAKKVDEKYSYLNTKFAKKIEKREFSQMMKDFGALFLYNINSVVINTTDSFVLSYYLGLKIVGIHSNYILITTALRRIINPIFTSIKSSLGNYMISEDKESTYMMFRAMNFAASFFFGSCAIGLFVLLNRFIDLWLGNQYTFSVFFSLLIAIEFYLGGIQLLLGQFRNSLGLFQQAKYRPLFSIIINLVLSVIFVQIYSVNGVVLSTIISSLTTYMWYDPIIIHKYGFQKNPKMYFYRNSIYLTFLICVGSAAFFISHRFPNNLTGLVFSFISSFTIILLSFYYAYRKTEEYKLILKYLKPSINKFNSKFYKLMK